MAEYLPFPENAIELADMVDGAPTQHAYILEENESRFFQAIEEGDLERVRATLRSSNNAVNINAINSKGQTPLQVAVKAKQEDIVKELLEHGADIRNALLQSVFDNDLEQIEMLFTTTTQCQGSTSKEGELHECYISPLILATQRGRYDIVRLLLKYDQFIGEPHEYFCECIRCEAVPDILRSQIAVNRFRGLSSPDYMCLKYIMDKSGKKDPLTQAFELNVKLSQRAVDEPELKKEYIKISERCKRFSADLLNECRSTKEITALLDVDEKYFGKRSRVKKQGRIAVSKTFRRAVDSSHKEFVAHPHTQQLLNIVVYSGFNQWKKRSFFLKLFLGLIYAIIFPVFAGIYIVAPYHWISRTMHTPVVKLLSHTSQFVVFLALLTASALRDNHKPTALEYLIFIFILAMIVQEFFEFLGHRPRRSYFFKWWNITITVMLALFVFAFVFWVIGFAITGGWSVVEYSPIKPEGKTGYQLLLLGNSFFSVATVLSFFHLLDLCQVSSVLGPLQLSLYRMLRDVVKFLLFFFGIFIAFSVGVRNLYSYYNSVIKDISEEYVERNETRPLATKNHPMSTFGESAISMFWALFDKIDLTDFNTDNKSFLITQDTGKVLFAFYSICAVMVALNMLIAMMSSSYELITEDEDIQWKFSRTRLWLEFIGKGSSLPPPYNLIPTPKIIYRMITTKGGVRRRDTIRTDDEEAQRERVLEAERETITKNLVQRYFSKRESQRKKEMSTLKDLEEWKNEILDEVRKIKAAMEQDQK